MTSVEKKAQKRSSQEVIRTELQEAVLEAAEEGRPCPDNLEDHFPGANLYPDGGFNSE